MTSLGTLRATTIALLVMTLAAPARAQEPREWQHMAASLRPGTRIELHLKDGTHVEGTVVAQDADLLVVNPRTRIPVDAWRVSYGEIQSIDVKRHEGMAPGAKVLVGVGIGAAAVFVGLLIAVASLAD